jgi:hypothetical protein
MKTKRKYLHVELSYNNMYIYSDDSKWRGEKTIRLENINEDCCVAGSIKQGLEKNKKYRFRIPLEDFMEK